jgi:biopolymer transport protein TolQ
MDDFGRELLNAIENAALVTSQSQPPQPPAYEETAPRRRS